MSDVVPAIVDANEAVAFRVNGLFVAEECGLVEIDAAARGERNAAAGVMSWDGAVEGVDASFHNEFDVFNVADAEKVAWLRGVEKRERPREHFACSIFRFTEVAAD